MSYTLQEADLRRFNEESGKQFTGFFVDRNIMIRVPRKLRGKDGRDEVLLTAFPRDQRIYLVGEPGEGKSTTVAQTGEDISLGKVDGIDSAVFVPLHNLHDTASVDSIVNWIATFGPAARFSPEFVSALLHRQETAVLLDGLDEIADSQRREGLTLGLNGLIERFPVARYITLSSRPWTEKPVVSGKGFSHYELSPLTESEVMDLFESEMAGVYAKALGHVEERERRQIEQHLETFRRKSKEVEGYSRLLRNPYFIRLAAVLDGQVPKHASTFLERSISDFLRSVKFDKTTRGEAQEKYGSEDTIGVLASDAEPLLEELAYKLHEAGKRSAPYDGIKNLAKWNIRGLRELTDEGKHKLIEFLAKTAPFFGISHTVGDTPYYYFTSLGIQEYFAGKKLGNNIVNARISGQSEMSIIGNKLSDPWWRQPIVYAAGSEYCKDSILKAVEETGNERFIADAFLFGLGGGMDLALRQRLEPIYLRFYQ